METDLARITRMLGLAIADNFTSGSPPPFKLVEVVEVPVLARFTQIMRRQWKSYPSLG